MMKLKKSKRFLQNEYLVCPDESSFEFSTKKLIYKPDKEACFTKSQLDQREEETFLTSISFGGLLKVA